MKAGTDQIDDEEQVAYQDAPSPPAAARSPEGYVTPDMNWKTGDMHAMEEYLYRKKVLAGVQEIEDEKKVGFQDPPPLSKQVCDPESPYYDANRANRPLVPLPPLPQNIAAQERPWWQKAITHPVQTFQNTMITWGRYSETGRKAIRSLTNAASDLNNPTRNPLSNAFGQAIRGGWAGLSYGVTSTIHFVSETIRSIRQGDWTRAKRYGGAWLKGAVQGWTWGTVQTIGQLAWGAVKMATPIGLFETIPTWWHTIQGLWQGKRGSWDVALASLMLMANLLGIYGTVNTVAFVRTARVTEPHPILAEVDPVMVAEGRAAWLTSDEAPPEAELTARMPNDSAALESVRLLETSTSKVEIIRVAQEMKNALSNGEKPPNLQETLDTEAFQCMQIEAWKVSL